MTVHATTQMAKTLLKAPSRPDDFLMLAERLEEVGREDLAVDLIEESCHFLGQEVARRLALEFGMCLQHAGRAFLTAPSSTPNHRPRPAPDGRRYLLPTNTSWCTVGPESTTAAVIPESLPTGPADWLGDHQIAFVVGQTICIFNLETQTHRWLPPLERPIAGLLSCKETLLLSVAPTQPGSLDLLLLNPGQPRPHLVPNLSLGLDSDALSWSGGVVCFGAGIQPTELRLLDPNDGSWLTRTVHQDPVELIAPATGGCFLTADRGGTMLLWGSSPFLPLERAGAKIALPRRKDGQRLEAIFDHRRRQLFVAQTHSQPWLLDIDNGTSRVIEEIVNSMPLGFADPDLAVPLAASDGWIWLRPHQGVMPPRWQTSVLLSTPTELSRAGVSLALANALTNDASFEVPPSKKARVKKPRAVLKALASGVLPSVP
jgi:hypothetical protein